MNLPYTPVDGVTGAVSAQFDFVVGRTPTEPVDGAGGFLEAGAPSPAPLPVDHPRVPRLHLRGLRQPDAGGHGVGRAALCADPNEVIDRNRQTATEDGSLDLYVEAAAVRGFYHVAFRLPGANTGTP